MSLKDQTTLRIVLYEGDGSQPLAAPDRFAAMSALLEKGFAVTRAAAAGAVARADRSSLLVLGQFTDGRLPQAEDAAEVLNMRVQTAEEVAGALFSAELKPNLPAGNAVTNVE